MVISAERDTLLTAREKLTATLCGQEELQRELTAQQDADIREYSNLRRHVFHSMILCCYSVKVFYHHQSYYCSQRL